MKTPEVCRRETLSQRTKTETQQEVLDKFKAGLGYLIQICSIHKLKIEIFATTVSLLRHYLPPKLTNKVRKVLNRESAGELVDNL